MVFKWHADFSPEGKDEVRWPLLSRSAKKTKQTNEQKMAAEKIVVRVKSKGIIRTHISIYIHVLFRGNNADSLATPQSLTYSCNSHSNLIQNGQKQSKQCTKKGYSKHHGQIVWFYTLLNYLIIFFPAFFKEPTTCLCLCIYCRSALNPRRGKLDIHPSGNCYFLDLQAVLSDEGFITTIPWSCYTSYSNKAAQLVRFTIQTSAGSWVF